MIELPIEEKHVPNVYLNATMMSDAQLFADTKQVVVPPVKQFLSVEVKADREQYQPQEDGTLSITTRDVDGKPVSAEVALGLIDESVKYIQQDYAGDPRQFYYGRKRTHTVQTQSTFNQKAYARLVERAKGQLVDRKNKGADDNEVLRVQSRYASVDGAAAGRGDLAAISPGAVSESVTIDGTDNRITTNLPVGGSEESLLKADSAMSRIRYARRI